jgi:cytochrome c oxidase cbb3-type subunit 2
MAWNWHRPLEAKGLTFSVLAGLAILVGGLVELIPPYFLQGTIEPVEGVRPYGALELEGRDVYVREGCSNCHSQMVRPFKTETDRYGPFTMAGEGVYDRPFLYGSRRTGPDLARVGGKYSDEWHVTHLTDPRSIVPQSIMPGYSFLAQTELDPTVAKAHLQVNRTLGVPYTDEQIANAAADMRAQAEPDGPNQDDFVKRYPKAIVRNFDGKPGLTEMDALVAYLQMLGTGVDFKLYDEKANLR